MYREETLMLAKIMRAAGINATYLHDADERVFEAKKSAIADLVWVPLAVGLVTNATWDPLSMCCVAWLADPPSRLHKYRGGRGAGEDMDRDWPGRSRPRRNRPPERA